MFKRLVVALHPDRAQHEPERQRRTEAMKAVTQAYEQGDLARMLELGALHSGSWTAAASPEEASTREDLLERTVSELKRQLRGILDELRAIRRSEAFRAAKDFERMQLAGEEPLEALQAEEQERLDQLVEVRDFVLAFQTGKIRFEEFLAGPEVLASGDDDLEMLADMLEEFMTDLESAAPRRRPTPRRARKPKKRA